MPQMAGHPIGAVRVLLPAVAAAALVLAVEPPPAAAQGQRPPVARERIELWPAGPPTVAGPASEATRKLIADHGGPRPGRATDVTVPTLTVHLPDEPVGTAVIVAPGGGYMFLSRDHEGEQVCGWLAGLGVTALLLEYRTPTRDESEPSAIPVADGRRALEIVRDRAAAWGVDPARVGMLGFSAGANLAGHAAWDRATPADAPAGGPPRPDFIVFIYGGGFLDRQHPERFREGFALPADAAPAFFAVAHDDKMAPVEAVRLFLEYRRLGRPAELHVYSSGGHGFGMRRSGRPIDDWPARCAEWMRAGGLLPAAAAGR